MTNNSASSIRSALSTHLSAVTQLKEVKTGRDMAFAGFPGCNFHLIGIEDELIDNKPSNYRTYKFAINVYQEMANKTRANAEADFEDAIDAVLDKLNAEWQLSSGGSPTVDETKIETGSVQQIEGPQGPMVWVQITLSAKTLIQ